MSSESFEWQKRSWYLDGMFEVDVQDWLRDRRHGPETSLQKGGAFSARVTTRMSLADNLSIILAF